MLKRALKSDIIHLSGGNTYHFLNALRKSGLIEHLRDFAFKGGVISGLSAGGIMLTPSIQTASFPDFDKDDNEIGLRSYKALSLVNFEFFPHYINTKRYNEPLLKHSRKTNRPIFALPDGSGILVNHEDTQFLGEAFCFHAGRKFKISDL